MTAKSMKTVFSAGVGAPKSEAEALVRILAENDWRDLRLESAHVDGLVFFPLKRALRSGEEELIRSAAPNAVFSEKDFTLREKKPRDLREALAGILSDAELAELVTSFDSVGDIGVIEIPKALEKKSDAIGWALLQVHPQFKTVLRIAGAHQGPFRVQPVQVIAGLANTVATYKENNCVFKVDLEKAFFSPRLATERDRIGRLIRPGEVVGCLFAGVGPFPIVFCRLSKLAKAVAIELNPFAVEWMKTNVALNRLSDRIEVVGGDVKEIVPARFANAFDRVVMPLPHGGEDFLVAAIAGTRPGGIVHFYSFETKENGFDSAAFKVRVASEKALCEAEILFQRVCRTFSPSTVQVVSDFRVTKK